MTTPTPDLSKCGICGQDAQFTDADPGANPVSYCARCLPAHMQTRAAAGQLPLAPGSTTVPTLQAQARELGLEGTSTMNKEELLEAVSKQQAAGFPTDTEPKGAAAQAIARGLLDPPASAAEVDTAPGADLSQVPATDVPAPVAMPIVSPTEDTPAAEAPAPKAARKK